MTIQDIITRGKGSTHGWRVERDQYDYDWATLVHYSTPMLTWNTKRPSEHEVLSLGWGSVSDQNGLNTAFRALDLPFRYNRDQRGGGARISDLPTKR
jgi:hypothetical protein